MSLPRYIQVPADITLVDIATGVTLMNAGSAPLTISFKSFICGTLLKDPKFGKTVSNVIAGAGIRAVLEAGGQVLKLDGDDYELLKSVLEAPETGYRAEVAIQIVPFFRAILDATTTDPRTG